MLNSLEIVKVYGVFSEEISNICFMKEFSRYSSNLWLTALANAAVAERCVSSMKFVQTSLSLTKWNDNQQTWRGIIASGG